MISNVPCQIERRDVPERVPPPPVAIAVYDTDNDPASTSEFRASNHSASKLPTSGAAPKILTPTEIGVLKKQGFTEGLAKSMAECGDVFPLRYWIIDNSGSMNHPDGHRIIETVKHDDVKIVECTRWEEIKECVKYHADLSGLLGAPTVFKLLNAPMVRGVDQQFSVGGERGTSQLDCEVMKRSMNKVSPSGFTPLRDRILEIHREVSSMSDALKANGQRVVIVLATDGTPTDETGVSGEWVTSQFIESMRLLEGLPVWIVIRLCTDEESVVNFYNDLDEQLELSLEVLDDFVAEASEVHAFNAWLNYALPLHRMREFGYHDSVFDLIDERKLTKSELLRFCTLLFGERNFDAVPDPNVDWSGFSSEIGRLVSMENNQWNPKKQRSGPWIDMRVLNKMYGQAGDHGCGDGCIIS